MSLKLSIITLFCFSFQQQILSFKKLNVADLGIFLDKVFTVFYLVIFVEKGYRMLSKLVPSIDILQLSLEVMSIKHMNEYY